MNKWSDGEQKKQLFYHSKYHCKEDTLVLVYLS